MKIQQGIVKHWTGDRGFGFIDCNECGDVFVHWSGIDMPGYKSLEPGQVVEFTTELDELRGKMRATNVRVIKY